MVSLFQVKHGNLSKWWSCHLSRRWFEAIILKTTLNMARYTRKCLCCSFIIKISMFLPRPVYTCKPIVNNCKVIWFSWLALKSSPLKVNLKCDEYWNACLIRIIDYFNNLWCYIRYLFFNLAYREKKNSSDIHKIYVKKWHRVSPG